MTDWQFICQGLLSDDQLQLSDKLNVRFIVFIAFKSPIRPYPLYKKQIVYSVLQIKDYTRQNKY